MLNLHFHNLLISRDLQIGHSWSMGDNGLLSCTKVVGVNTRKEGHFVGCLRVLQAGRDHAGHR